MLVSHNKHTKCPHFSKHYVSVIDTDRKIETALLHFHIFHMKKWSSGLLGNFSKDVQPTAESWPHFWAHILFLQHSPASYNV